MDYIRASQGSFENLLIDEENYNDEADWVAAAWRREGAADIPQGGAGGWRDGGGVECVEVRQEERKEEKEEEDLSGPSQSALEIFSEEEGTEDTLISIDRRLPWLETYLRGAQRSVQSINSKDNNIVVERADFRYVISLLCWFWRKFIAYRPSISRKLYKCGLGCDTPAFKWPKDLRRHIKDIHEIGARYQCPIAGCRHGDNTAHQSIKRKDKLRRHLQKNHNFQSADLLDLDLDWFLVLV